MMFRNNFPFFEAFCNYGCADFHRVVATDRGDRASNRAIQQGDAWALTLSHPANKLHCWFF